jgi:hypothetical protein
VILDSSSGCPASTTSGVLNFEKAVDDLISLMAIEVFRTFIRVASTPNGASEEIA